MAVVGDVALNGVSYLGVARDKSLGAAPRKVLLQRKGGIKQIKFSPGGSSFFPTFDTESLRRLYIYILCSHEGYL